ncbi:ATP-binding cassette domain-containing protein, partial [Bacillus velezensis]|uniref:ATP-binding cassette domain-containing protein n=1 Tax=Bacillus velezensis TaxID=492670 RepID=UPI00201BB26A
VLSMESEVEDISHSEKVDRTMQYGELTFEHGCFTYPGGGAPVLSDVSFQVRSVEKLAIMGALGAGKSTLLQLIPRFYEVTQGRIFVEGQD